MSIELNLLLFALVGLLMWAICKRIERVEVAAEDHEKWHREEPEGRVEVQQGKLQKSTEDAAAWDVFATLPWDEKLQECGSVIINPGEQAIIPTGLKTRMHGCDSLLFDRSGLAGKYRMTRRAGVIDENYPDEWGVVLVNEGRYPYRVNHGDRIAQAIFLPKFHIQVEGEGVLVLDAERKGGFGSTGA